MVPIGESRALGGCREGRATLAVNGRVGRRVACVLDDAGLSLEILDMEGLLLFVAWPTFGVFGVVTGTSGDGAARRLARGLYNSQMYATVLANDSDSVIHNTRVYRL